MNVQYFGTGSKNQETVPSEKSFVLESFVVTPNTNSEEYEYQSNVKLSKGFIGYNTFKEFLMHIYHMIINRLVRTAHLADLSNTKALPPGYVSQLITTTVDDIDESYKRGVKSVHIDKNYLQQEIDRLTALVKDRKDILLGTK